MSTFTLAISCLIISNLPWFMDLAFQVSIQYCCFTASDLASITSHIHDWVLFLLCLRLFILFGVISPLISSSILGTYWPGEFIFQCPVFLHFHPVHGVLTQEYWSGLPFPSPVTTFCQNSPSWPIRLGLPNSAGSLFHWVNKTVVHVMTVVSFLWVWFSVCVPSDGGGEEPGGSFLMGETDWGGNWVLFWRVGPCPVNI